MTRFKTQVFDLCHDICLSICQVGSDAEFMQNWQKLKTGIHSFYQHFLQGEWFWFIFLIMKHSLKEILTPKRKETSGQSRLEVLISVLTLYSRVSRSGVSRVTGWGKG